MLPVYPALRRIIEEYYTTNSFKAMLLQNAASLVPSSELADFLVREVATVGYSRPAAIFSNNAAFDATTGAIKFPDISISIAAGALPIQFDGVCLIRDPFANASVRITSIAGDILTATGLPCNNGDIGIFNSTGTYPAGIQANVAYGIFGSINTATNEFSLKNLTNNTQLTNIGTSWTGDLIWRPLVGTIELPFDLRPDNGLGDRTYTIQPNQNHIIKIKDFGIRVAP